MRFCSNFSLGPARSENDALVRSALFFDGEDTTLSVTGEELGAAVVCEDVFLLFVVYGQPFEDSLYIALIERPWAIVDWAVIGFSGVTGTLRDVRLAPPREVAFRFFAGKEWKIKVFKKRRLGSPITLPPIVRPNSVWRRFVVKSG